MKKDDTFNDEYLCVSWGNCDKSAYKPTLGTWSGYTLDAESAKCTAPTKKGIEN